MSQRPNVTPGRQSPRSSQAFYTPRTGLRSPRSSQAYVTVPTGRRSPPSSSVSSSKRRKPTHATIRHPRSRSNPMKLSLNLSLNVQPIKGDREQRFSLNKSFGPDDDVFYPESEKRTVRRSDGSNGGVSGAEPSGSRSSQGSTMNNRKIQRTRKVSSLKKPRTKSLGTSVRFRDTCPRTCPRRSNSNGSVTRVSGAESSASRSSQGSLKRAQTTGNRKNKQPLFSSSFEKPRSKSLTAMPGFQPYPRPRRLSFNDSDDADDEAVEIIKSDADKAFPLDNSMGIDDNLPVARVLNFDDPTDKHHGVVAVELKPSGSRTSHDSSKVGSPYKNNRPLLTFASLKKPRTKSLGTSPRRSSSNGSVISRGSVSSAKSSASRSSQGSTRKGRSTGNRYKNKRSLLTFSSLKKPRSKSLATTSLATSLGTPTRRLSINEVCGTKSPNSAIGLNDNSGSGLNVSAVSAPLDAIGSKVSPIFNHQRVVQIGFIANNIPMAVNCVLDIRSDQKILYVEPVQVLYEGFKIWRRSVREVQKEIEEKLAADKKN